MMTASFRIVISACQSSRFDDRCFNIIGNQFRSHMLILVIISRVTRLFRVDRPILIVSTLIREQGLGRYIWRSLPDPRDDFLLHPTENWISQTVRCVLPAIGSGRVYRIMGSRSHHPDRSNLPQLTCSFRADPHVFLDILMVS